MAITLMLLLFIGIFLIFCEMLLQTGVSLIVEDPKGAGDASGNGSGNGVSQHRRRTAQLATRKRKRRPQLPLATMGAAEEESSVGAGAAASAGPDATSAYWRGHVEDDADALRRRKQPLVREPMAALERDRSEREREREKQRQRLEPTDASPQGSNPSKAYRRPYGQAKKEPSTDAGEAAPTKTAVDLKNILKNSGGLSLSEILQQKNLSLDDLLKGKQNALLALQTTAVAPPASTYSSAAAARGDSPKKSTSQQSKQGVRRLPAAYTTTSTTGHDEDESSSSSSSTKNKAKFPTALQRLKLFGSSSRESITTRRILGGINSYGSSTTMATSTTASGSTTTSTTRVPLYKKRQHLRSTLRPPGLYKPLTSTILSTTTTTTAAAVSTTQEVETSTVYSTSTVVSNLEDSQEEERENSDEREREEEQVEEKLKNEEQEQELNNQENHENQDSQENQDLEEPEEQPDSSEAESGESNSHTEEPPPPAPPSPPAPSSALPPGGPRYRLRNSSIKEMQKRLKDNFIGGNVEMESGEEVAMEMASSTTSATPPSNKSGEELNYGEDELENFFDEVESHTHHTRVPAPPAPAPPAQSPTSVVAPPAPPAPSPSFEPPPPPARAAPPSLSAGRPPPQLNIIDDVDDRTDLLELIEDRRSGNRLFKVLEQRNMTLEELIEHRKRGSSQLHLSTIVSGGDEHSRLYPGQKVLLQDNMDIVTAFENFPHFNLMDLKSVKPDEIKTDSQGSSYFTSIIDIEPNDEVKPMGNRGPAYAQTSSSSATIGAGTGTISINSRGEKSLGFFPSWKTLALASLATATATEERNPYFLPPPRLLLDGSSSQETNQDQDQDLPGGGGGGEPTSIDIDLSVSPYGGSNSNGNSSSMLDNSRLPPSHNDDDVIDEIENEVARAHDLLDLELSGPGFHRSPAAAAATSAVSQQHLGSLYASMPSGIRSAIVASTAIVITALATFLVIFVVCRWKQQRRRKSSYLRTYNAMKSKLPQMVQPSRRSSMRQHMEELVVGSASGSGSGSGTGAGAGSGAGIASISTSVACCTPVHQLQRQSSLLFARDGSATLSTATSLTTNTSTNTTTISTGAQPPAPSEALSGRGLAISLRSAHQKLNTMDPNSPEVQEYLFDTLRKSFDN
ncbi:serine-rich adhesin for platelets [Drosophila gunungcola]|uniref:serine-rich adhesin for platelets n=1 Tax=Drosophila gunungcola TaxID=103775 RepID=UPI0022E26D8C|nr:serine-rich adhesin for platelets [Drosophila gunungcola]